MRVTVAAAVRDGTRLFVGAVRGAVSCRVVGGAGGAADDLDVGAIRCERRGCVPQGRWVLDLSMIYQRQRE